MVTSQDWIAQLKSSGFEHSGYWKLDQNSRAHIHVEAPEEPGVYVFAVDRQIHYVGSAQRGLRKRLRTYEIKESPGTAVRIRGLITEKLRAGCEVIVLTIVPAPISGEGSPIDPIAGLEIGLIRKIRPPWNKHNIGTAMADNSN